MTVTHHDLRRLACATAEPSDVLVEWLGPDEVDMTGEPGSFVELREGRRLMVLAQRDAACRWLGPDGRCRVYEVRPLDCQLFPFHLSAVQRGDAAELSLLPLSACDYASDGATDADQLATLDARRWRELAEYQSSVARWNRLAHHRRRLGHPSRQAHDFLAFLGLPSTEPP